MPTAPSLDNSRPSRNWILSGLLDHRTLVREIPNRVGRRSPKLSPAGAGTAEWVAYRVVWDLLTGGHKHALELDHCWTCNDDPRCCSPAHLESATRSENERRKKPARKINWRLRRGRLSWRSRRGSVYRFRQGTSESRFQ